MSDLRSELQRIAGDFVSAVVTAMRSASLSDLAEQSSRAGGAPAVSAPRRGPGRRPRAAAQSAQPVATVRPAARGRRHRASAEEVQNQKNLALATAKQLPAGFSKGDVMRRAGAKVDLGRALSLLVDEGRLTKKGDRRNTRYWVK